MNYYTIEIEVTNYCNAKCVFCANDALTRKRGYLDVCKFEKFILKQKEIVKDNYFRKNNILTLPRVTFCGLGDPLIHPEIDKLVGIARENGFYTQVVTNGKMLSCEVLKKMCALGLDEIAISLHSLDEDIYYKITGLRLSEIKNNIKECATLIKNHKLRFSIWRIYHPDKTFRKYNDDKDYVDFMQECGITSYSILGPSEPWFRDGVVPMSNCQMVNDYPFWCNKIMFTFNIDWEGNVVLCCNDYNRETVELGNVFDDEFNYEKLFCIKKQIIERKYIPQICKCCRRWEDNEILDIVEKYRLDINEICT